MRKTEGFPVANSSLQQSFLTRTLMRSFFGLELQGQTPWHVLGSIVLSPCAWFFAETKLSESSYKAKCAANICQQVRGCPCQKFAPRPAFLFECKRSEKTVVLMVRVAPARDRRSLTSIADAWLLISGVAFLARVQWFSAGSKNRTTDSMDLPQLHAVDPPSAASNLCVQVH